MYELGHDRELMFFRDVFLRVLPKFRTWHLILPSFIKLYGVSHYRIPCYERVGPQGFG